MVMAPTASALLGSSTKFSASGSVKAASVTVTGVKSLASWVTPVTPVAPVKRHGMNSNQAWLAATLRVCDGSSSVLLSV